MTRERVLTLTPILRQTSSTAVPASACCSAKAICWSVNFDFFIGYGPSRMAHRSRKTLTQAGPMSWEGTSLGRTLIGGGGKSPWQVTGCMEKDRSR